MKKKQSAVGLFFSMFLRAVVIILAIIIVVFGAFVVKKAIDNKKNIKTTEEASVDESILTADNDQVDEALAGSGTGEEETVTASSKDLKIEVLNGTETKGLAGAWKDKLSGLGFTQVDAHNLYSQLSNTKILVSQEGMGEDLREIFPSADFEIGTLTTNDTDAPIDGVDIFIMIGASDDIVSQ